MKVWEVVVSTELVRLYFFPTKKQADAFAREQRKELEEQGWDVTEDTIDVGPWEYRPGREGMAEALNDLISVTCHNEG